MTENSFLGSAGPWADLRLVIHEARSPLTVIAYASELLLDPAIQPEPRVQRQHLEAIHQAAHEAASCLSLLSRLLEVEQAAASPGIHAIPLEDFRDPDALTSGPPLPQGAILHADSRLSRHLCRSLWDLASCFPPPRARMVSATILDGRLMLQMHGPESFLQCVGADTTPAAPAAGPDPKHAPPFRARFLSNILRRALALLGGTTQPAGPGQSPGDLVLCIPDHAPAQRRRKPSNRRSP